MGLTTARNERDEALAKIKKLERRLEEMVAFFPVKSPPLTVGMFFFFPDSCSVFGASFGR